MRKLRACCVKCIACDEIKLWSEFVAYLLFALPWHHCKHYVRVKWRYFASKKMANEDDQKSAGGSNGHGSVEESAENVAEETETVVKQQESFSIASQPSELPAVPQQDEEAEETQEAQDLEQEESAEDLHELEEELDKITVSVPSL